MKIEDINPFIRCAGELMPITNKFYVKTYDHRLFYVKRGNCTLHIEDKKFDLSGDYVVYILAGTRYRFETAGEIIVCPINFDFTQANAQSVEFCTPVNEVDFNENDLKEKIKFSDYEMLNSFFVLKNGEKYRADIYSMIEELKKKNICCNAVASAILKKIICTMIRNSNIENKKTSKQIEKILEYIHTHFYEDITNKQLGNLVGYHPYYVNRLMISYANTTLRQYLINYRLNIAQDLLIKTEYSMQEISEKCGFKSIYYFSRCFKEKIGVAPNVYRKSRKML